MDRITQLHKEVNSPKFYINLENPIKMPKSFFVFLMLDNWFQNSNGKITRKNLK